MQRLKFNTPISAPKERVWRALLDDATYREWSGAFHAGSYAVTDWTAGSKALFLTPEGDGMVSRIAAHRPNEFLSLEHLGTVSRGVEDTNSDASKSWAGAHENYSLHETDGGVTLTVEMDTTEEYRKYFEETWPKALARLKEICERKAGKTAP